MINPGMVILNETKIDLKKALYDERFQIEDNIGESIHVHFRNFRFDFTVREFLDLSAAFQESLQALLQSEDIDLSLIAPDFLFTMRTHLPFIKKTELIIRTLDELQCVERMEGAKGPVKIVPIKESAVFAYLMNEKHERTRAGYGPAAFQDQQERINRIRAKFEKGGGLQGRYITLFDGRPIICDGSVQAAVQYYLKGNTEVKVLNITFAEGYNDHHIRSSGIGDRLRWSWRKFNDRLKKWNRKLRSAKIQKRLESKGY